MVEYVLGGSPTNKDSPLSALVPRLNNLKFDENDKVSDLKWIFNMVCLIYLHCLQMDRQTTTRIKETHHLITQTVSKSKTMDQDLVLWSMASMMIRRSSKKFKNFFLY